MTYFMGEFSRKKRLRKIAQVMREFKHGKLDKSYGGKVTNRKQAIAIALSEASKFSQQKSYDAEFGLIGTALMGGAALAGTAWAGMKGHKLYKHLFPKYTKTWNSIKPKILTKRNVGIGLGGLVATGAASYAGSKLYNNYREKRKKWWEL